MWWNPGWTIGDRGEQNIFVWCVVNTQQADICNKSSEQDIQDYKYQVWEKKTVQPDPGEPHYCEFLICCVYEFGLKYIYW